ncbi:MAG: heparinase II/III domain-containing protein [Promethearchaeia archaeon]
MFIKPEKGGNSGGYIIILDEVAEESESFEIETLLHTRGEIDVSSDSQSFISTVPSYISGDSISLKVSYLEEIQSIKEETGYFLPTHYQEDYPYDDLNAPYTRAKYSGSENPVMASILYPKNDSDAAQSFPKIQRQDNGLCTIGDNDLLFYSEKHEDKTFSNANVSFQGDMFFLRKDKDQETLLRYLFLQNSDNLEHNNRQYFSSSQPIVNSLVSYDNNSHINGLIRTFATQETKISLYCPFNATNMKVNGVNATYEQTDNIISFKNSGGSTSFAISNTTVAETQAQDPLSNPTPLRVLPRKSEWGFQADLFTQLKHPYILFNETELTSIKNKINDTEKVWNDWYNAYISNVDEISSPEDYAKESRFNHLYKLTLKYLINGGQKYLDTAKDFLDNIGQFNHFSQDLQRSYSVQSFALAFDILYNSFSTKERSKYSKYLTNLAAPLMQMDLYPDNNHRVVDAGGLGLAGLALKNLTMVNKAIETILVYYYTQNPADGGSYEGYSYNAYAMSEMLSFASALNRLESFNFFEDPQFMATLRFMGETLGPLGLPSLFEDCTFSSRLHEVLLISAAQINKIDPDLASNFQYLWEQRQNNSAYVGASDYGYINGGYPSFERILCYSVNKSLDAEPFKSRKEIWKDSSMAFLRTRDEEDAMFLSFSCKDYSQSHAHLDENSFELWAYGAYLINNPGYPGFGLKHHNWCIQTEGSNSLLIEGSGQRRSMADGLIASISSPYFSMAIGQADTIYNDYGSPHYALEFYLIFIINFIFLGVALILFYIITKKSTEVNSPQKSEEKIEKKESKTKQLYQTTQKKNPPDLTSNRSILYSLFFHPIALQKVIASEKNERKSRVVQRFIKYLAAGIFALFYLLSFIDIFATTNYHAQYFEDKVKWVFEILPYIEIALILIGIVLLYLFVSLFMKLYYQINYHLLKYTDLNRTIEEEMKEENERERIKTISYLSLMPLLPVMIFAPLLILFTTIQGLKSGIVKIFNQFGSVNEIYHELVVIVNELASNFLYIQIFFIPFLFFTLYIFYKSLKLSGTDKENKRRHRWIVIPLLSYFILSVIFFVFFIIISLLAVQGFSLVTIEGFVQG